MAKVLCVLYDDPVDGYPRSYARLDTQNRVLSRRSDGADSEGDRFYSRNTAGERRAAWV